MAVIGGQYRASPITYSNLDIVEALPTDVNGNLMVNLASGDSVSVTVGTINSGTINAGTINSGTINAGTINAGTINVGTMVHPIVSAAQTITVGSGKTSGTLTSTLNGMIWKITQTTPAMQGTPGSAATFLTDSAGGTIASLGTQAEATITNYGTQVPINTDFKWITNTSGDPDGTATADTNIIVLVHYQK